MVPVLLIILPLAGLILGFITRYLYSVAVLRSVEQQAVRTKKEAEKEADSIRQEARLAMKEELSTQRSQLEREYREERRDLQQFEKRLQQRDEDLDSRKKQVELEYKELRKQEAELAIQEKDLKSLIAQQHIELEKVAGLTQLEAREEIIASVKREAQAQALEIYQELEDEAKRDADKRAREIILGSLQRLATETTTESTAFTIQLPSEDIKGKIIGKQGRNIRSLEMLTGADVIVDDDPENVLISCFDPVRRTIAAMSLERLIKDGRIHPARIEETVYRVEREIRQVMKDEAEKVVAELGIALKPEAIEMLGRLHFRTSYGQNVLLHAKEAAMIAGLIAAEIGADRELARRAALLHDIGKAAPSNTGRTHVEHGVDLAKRWNESELVINAIASHHGDEEPLSLEAVIVQLADAISASRPGARRDVVGNYVQRVESYERISKEFPGVAQAFAIDGGRQLRVIVNQDEASDEDAMTIARGIAERIKDEVNYPGHVKITVIRETRITEYAR